MAQRAQTQSKAMEWQGAAFPFLTTMATLAAFCTMLLRFG